MPPFSGFTMSYTLARMRHASSTMPIPTVWAVPSIPSACNVVDTGREPKGFVSNRRRLLAKSAFRPPRMEFRDRGSLLYTYRPIPANPMTVALLLLLVVVTFLIGPLVAGPEGLWPLGGLCFLPVALVLGAIALFKPSQTRVFENGIEISFPLWRVMRGERRYYAWSEIRDVYPRSYEVAGSFLSPFASSAGTLVHTGIDPRIPVRFARISRVDGRDPRPIRPPSGADGADGPHLLRRPGPRATGPSARATHSRVAGVPGLPPPSRHPRGNPRRAIRRPRDADNPHRRRRVHRRVDSSGPIDDPDLAPERATKPASFGTREISGAREGRSLRRVGRFGEGLTRPALMPGSDGRSGRASVPQPRPQSGESVEPILQGVREGRQQGDDPRRVDEFVRLPIRTGPEGHDPRDAQSSEMIGDRSPGPLQTPGHFAVGHRSLHREAQDDGERRGPSTFGQQPTIDLVQAAGLLRKDQARREESTVVTVRHPNDEALPLEHPDVMADPAQRNADDPRELAHVDSGNRRNRIQDAAADTGPAGRQTLTPGRKWPRRSGGGSQPGGPPPRTTAALRPLGIRRPAG